MPSESSLRLCVLAVPAHPSIIFPNGYRHILFFTSASAPS